ncbi:hypothetical protein [Erythrobacter sp. CCH5-A1]|jgi:hypothetical protein|uniref:hypothetical protein n=1 Tax=Erythrobacter sp. CCH5-A1 TaxID=1768792 RepID=UPI000836F1F3|nr:hypothetical protein [Erythrobacter sp. CCH5-A1]
MQWITGLSKLGKAIAALIVLALAIWAFFFVRGLFVGDLATKAKLGTEQAGAALESGKDAVNTVGDAQRRDEATDKKVEGTQNDVNRATDGAGADRAGRDGLCLNFGICPDD